MTSEEAKEFLTDISYKLGNMSVEYLSEKDGEKMREAIKALEQEPCEQEIELVIKIPENIYEHIKNTWRKRRDICPESYIAWGTPLPKGHWIEVDTKMYACSNCSHCFSIVPEDNSIKQYHYCPNCKARMFGP